MKIAKSALLLAAVLATAVGLVWIGQGTGLFPYPASSFMIRDPSWAYAGAGLAAAGLAALVLLRRR